jgi:hypothetical protein
MNKFLPLATGIVCLGLLALAVFVFNPTCLPHYSRPEKNAFQPTWVEIFGRKEQLKQLEEGLHGYWEAKRQVTKEVIAGRCSLADAIEEFRKLDAPWLSASHQEQILKELRMSEVEWRGREVISLARRVLVDHPDEEAAVVDRLEKELHKLMADPNKQHPMFADPQIKSGSYRDPLSSTTRKPR